MGIRLPGSGQSRRVRQTASLVVAIAAVLAATPARAANEEIAVAMLLRVLAYDAGLRARVGDSVTVAVPGGPGCAAGDGELAALRRALGKVSTLTLQELPIKVVEISFTDGPSLAAALKATQADMIILGACLAGVVGVITPLTRAAKVTSAATSAPLVEAGVAIGIVPVPGKEKPRLMVNLPAAKAEGMTLRADALRVALVVE